ncbi:CehA/McbA family metallohydrolase [Sphingomonas sp. URHD0057]|uniref:CehA/McbA family metallohydrolase n=1 Tax=Sphingomonas sp. URHD0057 TaxID=1380389 RepID=UPI00055F8743|nr:CehA/McbA family metallohydrolase [Sphingomonas sp. URHD0057]
MKRFAAFAALLFAASAAIAAGREPVLKQVDLPHNYYWRELYIPQLTTGPSSVSFTPDGTALIYSMAGSLWRQAIGSDEATELTHPRGAYDYQPDVSADGRSVVFSSYNGDGIELWRLDLGTGAERQLTLGSDVNVEPRLSPDGKRIAWVSTQGTGHFNLCIADLDAGGIHNAHALLGDRQSKISRYYYSTWDHALNPSWTPDGKRILYVSNPEVAWGTGDIWSVAVDNPTDRRKVYGEETSWNARPETSPDGKLVLFASYHGRQWKQLWVTTPGGAAPLPLSFGEFDRWNARWSPDGKRIAYVDNEHGNTRLIVQTVAGGATIPIVAKTRRYSVPRARFTLDIRDEQGRAVSARVAVLGSDLRAAAPADVWMHADDGFDRALQSAETHYFDCASTCTIEALAGDTKVWVQRGFRYLPWQQTVKLAEGAVTLPVTLQLNDLPPSFGKFTSADLHVHMNYGGHYRNTPGNLARQARAEDLGVIYNLLVNKEERVPDIAYFQPDPDPASGDGVTILHSQEYHTSYWGHLGLLGLSDHYLTPGFVAYQNSPLASAWPDNGAIADLAHAQGALVGYVHPFDTVPDPVNDKSLSNELPADVANGKVDYMEIVGFSDHKSTAQVWYRLLNLGFRIPAGAGTDAMANYASPRGPVGMNRVFLETGGDASPAALKAALKAGRTFASNGPLLGLELDGKHPGATIARPAPGKIAYRIALRSPVAVDHLELVQNGKVVKAFALAGDRRNFDARGELDADTSGWILLRAWNDGADPQVLDIYLYATTSPVYVELPGGMPAAPDDAHYFIAWLDRVIADAGARKDFRSAGERDMVLAYLRKARNRYANLIVVRR